MIPLSYQGKFWACLLLAPFPETSHRWEPSTAVLSNPVQSRSVRCIDSCASNYQQLVFAGFPATAFGDAAAMLVPAEEPFQGMVFFCCLKQFFVV